MEHRLQHIKEVLQRGGERKDWTGREVRRERRRRGREISSRGGGGAEGGDSSVTMAMGILEITEGTVACRILTRHFAVVVQVLLVLSIKACWEKASKG